MGRAVVLLVLACLATPAIAHHDPKGPGTGVVACAYDNRNRTELPHGVVHAVSTSCHWRFLHVNYTQRLERVDYVVPDPSAQHGVRDAVTFLVDSLEMRFPNGTWENQTVVSLVVDEWRHASMRYNSTDAPPRERWCEMRAWAEPSTYDRFQYQRTAPQEVCRRQDGFLLPARPLLVP